jgi:HEAT repeat protein/beta-lactamase regulating signal transducer with metallopeptidase domain
MMPTGLDVTSAAIVSWLLTYAIHSTILLAGAAVVAWRFSDQHAWLDAIWKAALIGPLLTASLNLAPNAIPLGGRWPMPGATTVTGKPASAQPRVRERATETAATVEHVTAAPSAERPATAARSAPLETVEAAVSQPFIAWPSIAVIVWLLIAGRGLGRYGTRLIRLYRAVNSGRSVTSPDLLHAFDTLRGSAREQRSIRLTATDMCAVPLALAGRHIVLPERFLEQVAADEQRAALAHEMAHVIRRDPAWRIVAAAVEHTFFFQPLNRLARIRMTESAEFICDQWAVQHTGAPLALARSLSQVASWASPSNDTWAVGVSAMARSDSAMVRRVTQILNEPVQLARRPRALWLVIALAVVAVAAPRVTATVLPIPASATPMMAAVINVVTPSTAEPAAATQDRASHREWTAADIRDAQANLRVYRPARATDSLDDRWRWALADARRQRLSSFWVAYSFETPVHSQDLVMSDSDGNSFVSSNDWHEASGPPLRDVLGDGGGNMVVLLHYRGTGDADVDRAVYRSAGIGFDFERAPLFWLGYADESQSFDRVRGLFDRARPQGVQHLLIDLASMHGNSSVVIPFLTRLVDVSQPSGIRNEAAEGFGHHHDPRSVEILLRVARTDPLSEVRAEAAETIGEVQTPQAIPALTDLVNDSDDPEVRREAAEAFGDQPTDQALPALERVIANSTYEDVLTEAIEALGDLEGASVQSVLVQIVNTHPNRRAQQEAVETLGDIDDPGAADALLRIAFEHDNEQIQREAVETIGDRDEDAGAIAALERILRDHPSEGVQAEAIETLTDVPGQTLHPQIVALAASGRSPRIRRDALEAIADAVAESSDAQMLDRAEQTLERAIFDDPDTSVRMEALDGLEKLPRDRELRILRQVIDRHPDSRVRREAEDHVRDRRQ